MIMCIRFKLLNNLVKLYPLHLPTNQISLSENPNEWNKSLSICVWIAAQEQRHKTSYSLRRTL